MNEIETAWWKSKKLLALLVNHVLVGMIAVFGIVKQPAATGQVITGTVAELGAVSAAHQAGQAATDRAQAYSPNYPSNGVYPPQPPAPVTIVQPAGASVTLPPQAPTPPAGQTPGMNL